MDINKTKRYLIDNDLEIEKDLKEMKAILVSIQKVLGVNQLTPGKVTELSRKAMKQADKIRERLAKGKKDENN